MESYCGMRLKFPFYKMSSGVYGTDGCAALWMYLIPLNCTLKNGRDGEIC